MLSGSEFDELDAQLEEFIIQEEQGSLLNLDGDDSVVVPKRDTSISPT
jgi:hypothetical protein